MQTTEAPRVWRNQGINEVGDICLQSSQADRGCEVVAGSSRKCAFGVKNSARINVVLTAVKSEKYSYAIAGVFTLWQFALRKSPWTITYKKIYMHHRLK